MGSANNHLSSPYCIGILAEIDSGNVGSIMHFLDDSGQKIGGITLTTAGILITVRDNRATFNLDATGERYFQICSDGTQIWLYDSCSLEATDIITLVYKV